jgi:tetratricopeptide (TPR) repeat protein
VNLAMQAMQQLQSQQQATLRAVEDTRHEVETVSKRTAIVEIVLMVLLAGISLYAFTWLHGRRGRLAAPPMSGLVHAHVDQAASMAQLLAKGHELLRTKQLTASIACFDAVIALDGRSADAFVQKGVALERLGRLEEALDCYEQAIAIDHSSTDAFVGKGNVLNRLERYAEALQCYEEASHSQAKHAT